MADERRTVPWILKQAAAKCNEGAVVRWEAVASDAPSARPHADRGKDIDRNAIADRSLFRVFEARSPR
jgi:hypothetical protein